jgi:cyclopropane fatty-acyl-phospholipid synthase-like methyltransferase
VEREVFGSDFGTTGYTTVAQAKQLISELRLGAADRLLDIGAGAGWPGLYLSLEVGCRLVVTDLPIEGLVTADRRAAEERISSRVGSAVCSARNLPFRAATFDAIVHTDVLC